MTRRKSPYFMVTSVTEINIKTQKPQNFRHGNDLNFMVPSAAEINLKTWFLPLRK
jgi:hypothetical protein